MEKADFLDRVAGALAQRGVADAAILRYTEKTSALLDQLPPDELAAVLSERVDPERFVAEMLADEPGPAPAPREPRAPAQPAPKPQATPAPKPQTAPAPKPQTSPAPKPQTAPAPKPQTAPAPKPQAAPATGKEPAGASGSVSAKTEVVIDTGKLPSRGFSDRGREKEKASAAPVRDNRDYSRFWLIFWLTLPFTLALALAGAAVFAALILLLVLSIAGLTALLIAVAVAGTALALVGVIYGAIQIFSGAAPAGLYEIGTGLMIAGGTMLAGILLYNAAVRFAPYLIRKTAQLIAFTVRALKKLFVKIKGAMAQ